MKFEQTEVLKITFDLKFYKTLSLLISPDPANNNGYTRDFQELFNVTIRDLKSYIGFIKSMEQLTDRLFEKYIPRSATVMENIKEYAVAEIEEAVSKADAFALSSNYIKELEVDNKPITV